MLKNAALRFRSSPVGGLHVRVQFILLARGCRPKGLARNEDFPSLVGSDKGRSRFC
jgi:hypothetical protein